MSVHPFLSVILFHPKPLQYFPRSMGQTTGVAMVICTCGLVPMICCMKESPPQFLSDLQVGHAGEHLSLPPSSRGPITCIKFVV